MLMLGQCFVQLLLSFNVLMDLLIKVIDYFRCVNTSYTQKKQELT